MDRVLRARILGGLAAAGGIGLLAVGYPGPAAGMLSIGAAVVMLVTERDVPATLPEDASSGAMAAVATLASALNLEGRAFVLPGDTPDAPSRLFVPARDATFAELPPLGNSVVFSRESPGAMGAVVAPPGAGLESAWRKLRGLPTGQGPEEAALHVRGALEALGLGRDIVVSRGGEVVRVAYHPIALRELCRESREARAPWHLQGGCPSCSLAMILVARAHGAPVRVIDAGAEGARVFVDLEVGPRSRA